ncbi:MAG: helix-turn-helix transcriptional regulator [Candidatus Coproplasma sp.]
MIDIGNTLREHRQASGITQSALAKATDIKQQNISRWESNTHIPDIIECIKLADFYGITLDELVGRDSRSNSGAKYNIGTINNHGKIDMK